MAKKLQLPKIDLSRYNDKELPGHIIDIIKNALVVFEGDVNKVSKWYNLDKEKVSLLFEQHYLIISQIIQSKMKSEDLNVGIENAISLMTEHINELQTTKQSPIMRDHTVNNVNRITDRLIALKKEYNSTFDTLVNTMNTQSLKERQIRVLESGKPIDDADYLLNQNTVANMLSEYTRKNREKKVYVINVKTCESKIFEGDKAIQDAEDFLGCQGHLADVARQKSPYKGEWIVKYEPTKGPNTPKGE